MKHKWERSYADEQCCCFACGDVMDRKNGNAECDCDCDDAAEPRHMEQREYIYAARSSREERNW